MHEKYVRLVADRMIQPGATDWGMNIECFDWAPGVGLYGIFSAYQKTGDEKYLNFLEGWTKRHIDEAFCNKTVNSTAPLLTVCSMCAVRPNEAYTEVCRKIANYIICEAPLTSIGGLEHTVTEPVPGFAEQMWADTLFMACMFLVSFGKLTDEQKYIDFAVRQMVLHHKVLRSEDGLYYHGYNGVTKDHMSAVKWGRANAWIVYATAAILSEASDFAEYEEIKGNLTAQIHALEKVQRENGGFGTVLDDASSYVEISATAGIAAGIRLAVRTGLVDQTALLCAERATDAVIDAIEPDGTVGGVSTGTPVLALAEEYKRVKIFPSLYGQGLSILAL